MAFPSDWGGAVDGDAEFDDGPLAAKTTRTIGPNGMNRT
jgi:hypothetical protein